MVIKDALLGLAVGDALGVPVEFKKRQVLLQNPVTDMMGYGTHWQPEGTWSDDSSLAFCLAEALTQPFHLNTIADNFIRWMTQNYWTPRSRLFDIGHTTQQAIRRLQAGCPPELAGGMDVSENGNGSLMRILPLVFYTQNENTDERYQIVKDVSSLTHAHIRSVIACFYYTEFAKQLIIKEDKFSIYKELQAFLPDYLSSLSINQNEIMLFARLLHGNIYELPADQIHSSGYVIHTLEASIWCLLTTNTYSDAVLKAVNLGEDTDTTGAVAGGLAGILYGAEMVPTQWLTQLARRSDIEYLALRLENFTSSIKELL